MHLKVLILTLATLVAKDAFVCASDASDASNDDDIITTIVYRETYSGSQKYGCYVYNQNGLLLGLVYALITEEKRHSLQHKKHKKYLAVHGRWSDPTLGEKTRLYDTLNYDSSYKDPKLRVATSVNHVGNPEGLKAAASEIAEKLENRDQSLSERSLKGNMLFGYSRDEEKKKQLLNEDAQVINENLQKYDLTRIINENLKTYGLTRKYVTTSASAKTTKAGRAGHQMAETKRAKGGGNFEEELLQLDQDLSMAIGH